jgi:hypothetical protein
MTGLFDRLLEAHARGDARALITLYTEAAETANDPVAHGFYLTHAYVFALEQGDPRARDLHARLKAQGRES